MWQTSNSELGFDPTKGADADAGAGAATGRSVLGVSMRHNNNGKMPPGGTPGALALGGEWRDDDSSSLGPLDYAAHGPIAEVVKRRSKLADPGGTGEADVGGWAHVPRMRLRGQDPLGGPDRGRSGVHWGTLHTRNLKETGGGGEAEAVGREPRESKPWEQRGMHPGRRKQPVGGADVLTGLWMNSGQSYGNSFDAFKLDRTAKSEAKKAQTREQQEAAYRPERVLSTAAVNGFLLDEGGAAEARKYIAAEQAERAKRSGKNTPLSAAEQYKLKNQLRKLNIDGLNV